MGKIEEALKCLFGESVEDKLKSIPDVEIPDDFYYDETTGKWLHKKLYTFETYIKDKNFLIFEGCTTIPLNNSFVAINQENVLFNSVSVSLHLHPENGTDSFNIILYDYVYNEYIQIDQIVSGTVVHFNKIIRFTPTKNIKCFIQSTEPAYYKITFFFNKFRSDSEIEDIITAELIDGESIDNRIDTLIALINHNELSGLNAGDVYEHISAAQLAALHAIVVASDLNHNELSGLNAGDVYEHISAAQLAALHAEVHTLASHSAFALGGDLDLNDHNIVFDPAQSSDGDYNGIMQSATVDENTQGFGNLLHLNTDGHYIDAHADNEATMPCHAIALETGTGTKKIMKIGYIREDDWSWTKGAWLWVDMTTSGDITKTKPTGTGKFVQCVGYAETDKIIYFNPDKEYFELS